MCEQEYNQGHAGEVMDKVFKEELVKRSEYPENFIPAGGINFVGIDEGSPDGDCTVKGFYHNGKYYVNSVEYRTNNPYNKGK